MKTRYKILIVIGISIFAYVFIHSPLPQICKYIVDEPSECKLVWNLLMVTSIHLETVHDNWTPDVDGGVIVNEITYEIKLEDNLNFIFIFIIIPSLVIGIILYRDRK